MNTFQFTHFGRRVTIRHNIPERRFMRLYKNWSYESGRTDPAEFIKHINSLLLHRIFCWHAWQAKLTVN